MITLSTPSEIVAPISPCMLVGMPTLERQRKMSCVPEDTWMHVNVISGFGADAKVVPESFVFVKTLFVDVEDSESRVDMVIHGRTGEVMVIKEYLIETSKDLTPSVFAKKVEYEIEVMTHHVPRHPSICPLLGWFRGGWVAGKEASTCKSHYNLLMPWLQNDAAPLSFDYIFNWARSTLNVLIHLHDHNVICTNLKADCMMYNSSESTFVYIDFGDFLIDDHNYPYADNGSGLLMAPEQITGVFNHKVDSFSLGIILAQMALGHEDIFKKFGTLKRAQRDEFWERLKGRTLDHKLNFWNAYALEGFKQFWTPELSDLIHDLTEFDPASRLSCRDALYHPFFQSYSSC